MAVSSCQRSRSAASPNTSTASIPAAIAEHEQEIGRATSHGDVALRVRVLDFGTGGREPHEPFTVAVGAVEVERLAVADHAVTQAVGHDRVEELIDPVGGELRVDRIGRAISTIGGELHVDSVQRDLLGLASRPEARLAHDRERSTSRSRAGWRAAP